MNSDDPSYRQAVASSLYRTMAKNYRKRSV